MTTKLFLASLLYLTFCLVSAQNPQGFNYQAIARGSDGKELISTPLQVKLSVLSDTNGFKATGAGVYVWEEQQNAVTNSFGLFNLTFGNPLATKIQGSAATFSAINWKAQPLYMGVKINPNGTGWKILGSAKLWSVPYSMVSGDLAGPVSKLAVTGTTAVMDEALFEVKNKDGQTVFAVYNEGVRIYVDDGVAKGVKGGFAIGGFGTAKAPSQPYFVVDADSIRGYINTNPLKPTKGGFAIGGFTPAKAISNEFLRVTSDSVRIYIDNTNLKGTKGGFAIGGFSPAKGLKDPFLYLTPDASNQGAYNTFIGFQSGLSNTTGTKNTTLGYRAGTRNNSGSSNIMIGDSAGASSTYGSNNVFIGSKSGSLAQTPSSNICMGNYTGYRLTSGWNNIFLGNRSGWNTTTGYHNVFIGNEAGKNNVQGQDNIFIGPYSGYSNNSGSNIFIGGNSGRDNTDGYVNVFVGSSSGRKNQTGWGNIYLGESSGSENLTGNANICIGQTAGEFVKGSYNTIIGAFAGLNNIGSRNVFLGSEAGRNETGSNLLYISNSSTSTPLIWGNFSSGYLRFNAYVGINALPNSSYSLLAVQPDTWVSRIFATGVSEGAGMMFVGQSETYGGGIAYDGDGSPDIIGANDRITFFRRNNNVDTEVFSYSNANSDVGFAGRVGINTSAPAAQLDVAGNARVGVNGSVISAIIKITITGRDLPSIAANTSNLQTFSVPNADVTGVVSISPSADLPDGLDIAFARVSAAGTVTVKFRNVTAAAIDPASMSFYISVVQ
jgi:hypothetical protein